MIVLNHNLLVDNVNGTLNQVYTVLVYSMNVVFLHHHRHWINRMICIHYSYHKLDVFYIVFICSPTYTINSLSSTTEQSIITPFELITVNPYTILNLSTQRIIAKKELKAVHMCLFLLNLFLGNGFLINRNVEINFRKIFIRKRRCHLSYWINLNISRVRFG